MSTAEKHPANHMRHGAGEKVLGETYSVLFAFLSERYIPGPSVSLGLDKVELEPSIINRSSRERRPKIDTGKQ
jgi:hypothetical protein